MRGHKHLLDMRMHRGKPAGYVCISVLDNDHSWIADHWHESGITGPYIAIGANESIDRLDLRCVLCLEVVIDGSQAHEAAVWRIFDACVRQGAARVIAAVWREKGTSGEMETVQQRDSKGILTWPT
jgi:hypothetical protein